MMPVEYAEQLSAQLPAIIKEAVVKAKQLNTGLTLAGPADLNNLKVKR